ncbi:hypothetical protein [Paracoccus isoporae]|nr:hypothetical protein [Paracoccus isoporae]
MFRAVPILLFLALHAAAAPQPGPPPLPFHEVMRLVEERYRGRVLAARMERAAPLEYAAGTDLVQILTLLTPARHIIRIRLDAVSGEVLNLRGRGILDAQKSASHPGPPTSRGRAGRGDAKDR